MLLTTIKTKLEDFRIMIVYKANLLKKKLDASALAKYFVSMRTSIKVLVSVCVVVGIAIFGFFGF